MRRLVTFGMVVSVAQYAFGGMVISEWMYNGAGTGSTGEFVEFTNTGPASVDMTGWSFDDNSRTPGSAPLSTLGIVGPGKSVILTDETAANFITIWGLSGVSVVGDNTNNLGRSDEINLYDAGNNLVDRLTYNDQAVPPQGPRTQNVSCNIPATDYGYTVAQSGWVLAVVGDSYGSWKSSRGEIGSPGQVPEPITLTMFLVGGLMMSRRHV